MQRRDPSLALYRALLGLYPRRFRSLYGPHMLQVFGDCLRDARTQGPGGVARLWLATLLDLIRSAIEERTRRGFTMTREGFIRLSGPLWMFGGALILVSLLSGFETRFDDPLGGPDLWYELAGTLWTPALLLIVVGLAGFYRQHRDAIGLPGRFAVVGAGIAATASAGGGLLLGLDLARIVRSEFGWFLFVFGIMALLGNLLLLGIATLRHRPLPKWNALPLVLGIVPWLGFPLGELGFALVMTVFGVGWILFGYLLYRGSEATAEANPAV